MFLRILKKDLKRKKTMNIILLMFIILCSMFAAASVNNIIAVTGGIDRYFEMAEVPELMVGISPLRAKDNTERIEDMIKEHSSVTSVKTEKYIDGVSSKSFELNGSKMNNFINPAMLMSEKDMAIKYYDDGNNVITEVKKDSFYASTPFLQDIDLKKGDKLKLTYKGNTTELIYAGHVKAATSSAESSANPILILDSGLFDRINKDNDHGTFRINYVKTSDPDAVKKMLEEENGVSVTTREDVKSIYIYDMLSAYIMMAISVILLITVFIVLRFCIGFTVSEDFREIGVMKAVGINNNSIRSLYIIKYLAISVIGALAGFAASFPVGRVMLETVSKNMVLDSEHSSIMGLVSTACVVALILIFCYGCTGRVKKLSPIDAVRSGQTGERFGKKSILSLGRSRLPSAGFMALNDVFSAPKQFGMITLVFTLCLLMMTLMSNFALTLKSDKILWLFSIPESDAHIMDVDCFMDIFYDRTACDDIVDDTEKMLADNGMPGKCSMNISFPCDASHGDKTAKLSLNVTKGNISESKRVEEGYAPRKDNEIMLTDSALKDLDAKIGDHITADIDGETHEFIITGRYAAFNFHSAFLSSGFEFSHAPARGTMGVQIRFDGSPDQQQTDKNIEKLRDILDTEKVLNTSDMIKTVTGMSDTLNAVKKVIMALTVIVTSLIVILMERSMISKEKSEIALMKAVGIANKDIILHHMLRFVIVSAAAVLIESAALMPLSNIIMTRVCKLIGDVSEIECAFDPVEIFAVFPALLIGVTAVGSLLTALYTKTIKSSDTASIE